MKIKYECTCGHMFASETEVDTCPSCNLKTLSKIETKGVAVVEVATPGGDGSAMDQIKGIMSGIQKELTAKNTDMDSRMEKMAVDIEKVTQLQSEVKGERKGGDDVSSMLVKTMLSNQGMLSEDKIMLMDSQDDLIKQAQQANDNLYLMQCLYDAKNKGDSVINTDYYKQVAVNPILKGMFDSTGVGAEWVPTGFSASMIDIVNLELRVADLFVRETMPTNPYVSPLKTGHAKAYRTTKSGSDAPAKFKASNVATSNMTYEAELITARVVWEGAWDEDSIIASLPMLRADIAYAIASAIESTILNGCASDYTFDATDMHGDDISGSSPEASWDGLRYTAKLIDDGSKTAVTDLGGSFATDGTSLTSARAEMSKYGLFPKDVVMITSIKGYFQALSTLRDIQTLDKFGPNALILSGEIAKAQGIPVLVSEYAREDLDANGVLAGTGGAADTNIMFLNSRGFRIGDRRQFTIESNKIQGTDALEIWATIRLDFQPVYPTAEAVVHNLVDVN